MTTDTTTYRVQFSGLSEALTRRACEGFVGGSVANIRVWGAGNSDTTAEFTIAAEDADALRAELEADDRVTFYFAR